MRHVIGGEDSSPVGTTLSEPGVDRAGADRHDPHAVSPHLQHERLREPEHRVLRRAVGGAALDAVLARERRDIDDGAAACVHHSLEEGSGDEIQRAHVHAHGRVPVLERQLGEGLEPPDSSIVHDDAGGASFPAHEGRERVHPGRVGDVARHSECVDPGRLEVTHRSVHVRLRAGADGYTGPRAAQGECRGATDPCGRTGHDRERARNVHIRSKYTAPGATRRGNHVAFSNIWRRLCNDRYTASDF